MEEKKENIQQIDKKQIDSNLIVENIKSSQRNIPTDLIDDDPKPQKDENLLKKEQKNIERIKFPENNPEPKKQTNLKVEIKLN